MKTLLVILIASMIAVVVFTEPSVVSAQSDAQISTIRAQYASINKRASRYKRVKKELSGFSLEGGELIAYLNGPSIVKLVATHYGEMGRSTEEYYYQDEKLIFVFEKTSHYNKPMGRVARSTENRYYFNNDRLIRWVDKNGKQADTSSEEARSKQKDLLENSNLLSTGARSKNRTIEHRE